MNATTAFPFTAAVILNFNRPGDTLKCIASLQEGTFVPHKILVVDNNSSDNSVDIIRNAYPEIEIVRNKENRGYAGGMNSGIRRALELQPTYVLVLNSDTTVEHDYTRLLAEALSASAPAGAATGTIYFAQDRARIWYAGGEIAYWRGTASIRDRLPDTSASRRVTFFSGCGVMVRATAFETAGLFDEDFFMYLEDTELSVRLVKHGFEILYVPDAVLYHRVTNNELKPLPVYYGFRNRLLFLRRSASGISRWIGWMYLGSTYLLKLFIWLFYQPILHRAARFGIFDYFHRNFDKGRGLSFGRKDAVD